MSDVSDRRLFLSFYEYAVLLGVPCDACSELISRFIPHYELINLATDGLGLVAILPFFPSFSIFTVGLNPSEPSLHGEDR